MVLAEIGTAGVISAYFFRHMTSGYSLNVSDPIEGRPVQLSYYLCVFGCGLVFWLLVLLRAKLHGSGDRQADIRKVAKLAKLITLITTLNLCGSLLAPFMKLPLLVRHLVLFQVSSNLALLLIWTFLSLKECMIVLDAHTQQKQISSPEPQAVHSCPGYPQKSRGGYRGYLPSCRQIKRIFPIKFEKSRTVVYDADLRRLEEDLSALKVEFKALEEDLESGIGNGSGASGREEKNRGRYGGNDGGGGAGGGGDRGASGAGGHGRDEGGTGSGHGSGAGGSGENRGRSEGGDRGRDGGGGGGDPESGGRETNTEQAFKSSKITEMSLMLTAQTTAALIGFHLTTPSSSSKALLVIVLIDQLVAYLCGLTSILLSSNKPEDTKAAKIFADIGFVCTALGFILMVAMFVPWYLVLIAVLLFGVVWLIFFRNRLKTRATEVWNYLKNSTQSIKNCIGMLFESGS